MYFFYYFLALLNSYTVVFLFSKFVFFITILDKEVKNTPDEFVSDSLQASSQDLVEVQEGMKKLSLGPKHCGKQYFFNFVLCFCLFNFFTHLSTQCHSKCISRCWVAFTKFYPFISIMKLRKELCIDCSHISY